MCKIARADSWMPSRYPDQRFAFVIFDFGTGYVMRLFEDAEDRNYFIRRVWKWAKKRPQSSGWIRWRRPAPPPPRLI